MVRDARGLGCGEGERSSADFTEHALDELVGRDDLLLLPRATDAHRDVRRLGPRFPTTAMYGTFIISASRTR